MLRILGGSAKGRKIKLPPGDVRPATARIRQSLFDYLSDLTPGAKVLDLYCGSGGLGLEALSRGSAFTWFVDISARVIRTVQENAHTLKFHERTKYTQQDVFRFLRREYIGERFDIIFAAPPYRLAEPQMILKALAASKTEQIGSSESFESILEQGAVVCLEYSNHTEFPSSDDFSLDRRKIYGETVIDVWDWV
ncbi:MAG: RsmD family RNA methyltransferase [Candidatus Electryoneaceae bacterium]|nr:RsmD family RNA methyltransferase [Candidatus Electryoneaceae bacterium]